MRNRGVLAVVVLLLGLMVPVQSTGATADPAEADIRAFLEKFLSSFANLDWPAFKECFSERATVFHPAPPNQHRTDSRSRFEEAWLGVFERIKKESGRSSPPYMELKPEDLQIEILSAEVALVTFHLTSSNVLSRRTLVLKKFPGGWRIVHIHASNLAIP